MCGCGQPAPLAKFTDRRKGHIKGQPVKYISGHNNRGKKKSVETRRRMSVAMHGNRNGAGPRQATSLELANVHAWLNRWYPKAGRCERCGKNGRTDYAFRRHPEPYTHNRADYLELCRRCHMALDIATGVRPSLGAS